MPPSLYQCMSLPQIPTARRRTSTSPAPGSGGAGIGRASNRRGATSWMEFIRVIKKYNALRTHGCSSVLEKQPGPQHWMQIRLAKRDRTGSSLRLSVSAVQNVPLLLLLFEPAAYAQIKSKTELPMIGP